MATVSVGIVPFDLVVTLSEGDNFVATFINPNGPWADGTQAIMRFKPDGADWIEWPATTIGANLEWNVDSALVNALILTGVRFVRVRLIEPGGRKLPWGKGRVNVS